MKNAAKVTISRDSRDRFNIRVKDDLSGVSIVEVSMTPHDFAMALSGLAETGAAFERCCTPQQAELIGRKKIVERAQCVKVSGREAQKAAVLAHFNEHYAGEWVIWGDGTSSQQPGTQHAYWIARWEPAT